MTVAGLVLALTLGSRKMTFRNLVQRAVVGHALRADCPDAHAPQSADHRSCAMRCRAPIGSEKLSLVQRLGSEKLPRAAEVTNIPSLHLVIRV